MKPVHNKEKAHLALQREASGLGHVYILPGYSHKIEKLNSVMTFRNSEQILESAWFNYIGIHLAGVTDLIAAESEYHLLCVHSFTRSAEKTRLASKGTYLAMIWLSSELEYAADKGQVIRLDDAWK